MRLLFKTIVLLSVAMFGPTLAMSSDLYDVLCDSKVEVYSCHPAHPHGLVLDFSELRTKLNHFGAGFMTVKMVSGETKTSRQFKALETVILLGNDSIHPKEIKSLNVSATWPEWRTVVQMAAGGAMFFGGIGLVIDGLQWVGGSGDLGATGTGALVGAGLFGGMGLLVARDRFDVMIQEGIEQRTVSLPFKGIETLLKSGESFRENVLVAQP